MPITYVNKHSVPTSFDGLLFSLLFSEINYLGQDHVAYILGEESYNIIMKTSLLAYNRRWNTAITYAWATKHEDIFDKYICSTYILVGTYW